MWKPFGTRNNIKYATSLVQISGECLLSPLICTKFVSYFVLFKATSKVAL